MVRSRRHLACGLNEPKPAAVWLTPTQTEWELHLISVKWELRAKVTQTGWEQIAGREIGGPRLKEG